MNKEDLLRQITCSYVNEKDLKSEQERILSTPVFRQLKND